MDAGKAKIRAQMLELRKRFDGATLKRCSQSICRRLLTLPAVENAGCLVLYAAMGNEVDLSVLIEDCQERGRSFLLPRFVSERLGYQLVAVRHMQRDTVPGKWGIMEPRADLEPVPVSRTRQEDCTWIVPGVAFDQSARRLGRGGGHYDRLLNQAKGYKVGVACDCQVLPVLPADHHDIAMDMVVTEQRVIHRPSERSVVIQSTAGEQAAPRHQVELNVIKPRRCSAGAEHTVD